MTANVSGVEGNGDREPHSNTPYLYPGDGSQIHPVRSANPVNCSRRLGRGNYRGKNIEKNFHGAIKDTSP